MDRAAGAACGLVERLLTSERPDGQAVLLNVNFPEGEMQGTRATRLGYRNYDEGVVVRQDPRGRDYVWIGGEGATRHEPMAGSDTEAVDSGYVSVTPLLLSATFPDHLGIAAFVAGGASEVEA
jgi:5'-nucleotidase